MERDEVGKEFRDRFEANECFGLLDELLQGKYRQIYSKFLPKEIDDQKYFSWLKPEGNGLIWLGDYSLDLLKDKEGNDVYQFENDLKISASFYYQSKESNQTHKIELPTLFLTLRVSAYDFPNALSRNTNLEIWTPEQKTINHYNELIYKKYEEFGFKSLNYRPSKDKFELLTQIWPNIDKQNEKQNYTVSYYYFQEIVESYDLIMFLLTNANIYSEFTSNYLEKPVDLPEDGRYYQMNLTSDDKRYLDFCSMTLERIYAFWERIALLLFQFIKPVTLKKTTWSNALYQKIRALIGLKKTNTPEPFINDKNLSLIKLIDQLKKEAKKHHPVLCEPHSVFEWFKTFAKGDHRKLSNYRHPLIHYRLDDNSEIGKGGLYANTQVFWLQNIKDKAKLENLQKENESLLPFLNEQFKQCEIGFDKAVQLILEIQEAKKQERSLQ